jgi:RNA methyltransferase, TrmH family
VATALDAGAAFRFAVGSSGSGDANALAGVLQAAGVEVVEVTPEVLGGLADTESPQGILAVVEEPGATLPSPSPSPLRILVLDAVQDPGNAGALVRSAVALGAHAVVALDGTVDPWNPKAVRASAGEVFRLPVLRWREDELLRFLQREEVALVVADAGGEDIRGLPPASRWAPAGWALVVGNEGAGPRPALRAAARRVVALPLASRAESLNAAVAGALLLWALGPAQDPPPPLPHRTSP